MKTLAGNADLKRKLQQWEGPTAATGLVLPSIANIEQGVNKMARECDCSNPHLDAFDVLVSDKLILLNIIGRLN
jgi:hypothetical protein